MRKPRKPTFQSSQQIAHDRDQDAINLKDRFLVAYRKWGYRTRAAEEIGITWKTVERWLHEDEAFREHFDDIQSEIELIWQDDLEEAGLRRALSHSDLLLKFILAKLNPKYRDKSEVEHHGTVVFKENISTDGL
jgi:hypothetical protein